MHEVVVHSESQQPRLYAQAVEYPTVPLIVIKVMCWPRNNYKVKSMKTPVHHEMYKMPLGQERSAEEKERKKEKNPKV
jgi:hypothetical protein